jgi:hypothetical protein
MSNWILTLWVRHRHKVGWFEDAARNESRTLLVLRKLHKLKRIMRRTQSQPKSESILRSHRDIRTLYSKITAALRDEPMLHTLSEVVTVGVLGKYSEYGCIQSVMPCALKRNRQVVVVSNRRIQEVWDVKAITPELVIDPKRGVARKRLDHRYQHKENFEREHYHRQCYQWCQFHRKQWVSSWMCHPGDFWWMESSPRCTSSCRW